MLKYKQNRKLVQLTCDECGKLYDKPIIEYNRNIRLGRHNYCCRSCAMKGNKNNKKGNSVTLIPNNHKDEFTPFRYYFRNAKKRFKNFNLTLEYLKEIWEQQNGICPYTGIKLQLATYTTNHNNPIYTASLDRIDSSKGYEIDNVQFISTAINYMKNTMSHEDTLKLCEIIAEKYSGDGGIR